MTNWKEYGVPFEDFTEEITRKWVGLNFSKEQCKEWLDIGLKSEDVNFVYWLVKEIKLVPEKILNEGSEEELRELYTNLKDQGYIDKKELENKEEISYQGINVQEWLDKNYPKEVRSLIKNLYIRNKWLEGSLNLNDFTNLEKLDCSYNKITGLELTGLEKLGKIYCNDNYLTNVDYSSLNPEKLFELNISDNNLPEQDLSVFSHLINLETLQIGSGTEKRIKEGIYNRFYGSLESLKNLPKLTNLNIANTDINRGVKYLPVSIEYLHYSATQRPTSKVKEIAEELNSFLNFKVENRKKRNWMDIHPDFDKEKQREWEQLGFDYQQVKQWIEAGLQPNDANFVAYLRLNGYNPQQNLCWEKLRKEEKSVQKWLDKEYPLEKRKWISWLDIKRNGLEGDLIIESFSNLERLDCSINHFTGVTLNNLPKLTYFDASDNKIANLTIHNCPEISWLIVENNFLTDLNFVNSLVTNKLIYLGISNNNFPPSNIVVFSKFKNLKHLYLTGNRFYGNLQSLRNLNKLEELLFAGTEVDSGLEYLPNSLKEFTLVSPESTSSNTNKFELIGWTEPVRKEKSFIDNPYYDFKYWKETQPHFKWLKEKLKKINPHLNIYDVLQNIFFNVKTGDFEGNLQGLTSLLQINKTLLEEKEQEINLLELRVQELFILIKRQKEKIVNAYLSFSSEKELLQKLIKTHLELVKVKKQKLPIIKYRRQQENIYEELMEKIGEELMEEVEVILADCEELVAWELELQSKLGDKLLLIESKKQVLSITINDNIIRNYSSDNSQDDYKKDLTQEILIKQLQIKKNELDELITQTKIKLGNELETLLGVLLQIQIDIIQLGSNPTVEKRFQDLATIFEKRISREEIENICQKQREVVLLEENRIESSLETEKQEKEMKLEARIEAPTSKK